MKSCKDCVFYNVCYFRRIIENTFRENFDTGYPFSVDRVAEICAFYKEKESE